MMIDVVSMVIAPAFSAIVAWFVSKKKYKAEVHTNELENVEKSISIYREMVEDLSERVNLLSIGLKELREENEMLIVENRSLSLKNKILISELKKA